MKNKLAKSLLKNNKRSSLFLVVIVAAFIALLLSSGNTFAALKENIQKDFKDTYGEHHAIYYCVSERQYDDLQQDADIESVGIIKNYGLFTTRDGEKVTVGSLDDIAIRLGHITLTEGTFPSAKNEAAIESNIAAQNNWQVGTTITLQIPNDSTEKEYIITGIIDNFSGVWNVPFNIERGLSDLPAMLVQEDTLQAKSTHTVIQLFHYSHDEVWNIADNSYIEPNYAVVNSNAYDNADVFVNLSVIFDYIFAALLLIGFIIILRTASKTYIANYDHAFTVFTQQGMAYKHLSTIVHKMYFSILVVAVPVGVLCGFALQYLTLSIAGIHATAAIYPITVVKVVLCLVLYEIITAASYKKKLETYYQIEKEKDSIDAIEIKDGLKPSLLKYNIRHTMPKIAAILILIVLFIGSVMISSLVSSALFTKQNKGLFDYRVAAYSTKVTMTYPGVDLMGTKDRTFDYDTAESLGKLPAVGFMVSTPQTDCAAIQIDDSNKDLAIWQSETMPISEGDAVPACIDRPQKTIKDYVMFVVDENNFAVFEQHYPNLITKEFLSGDTAILFASNADESIQKRQLQFLRLEYDTDFETARHNTDRISCKQYALDIQNTVAANFYLKNDEAEILSDLPTLIIPRSALRNNDLFRGISDIYFYLQPGAKAAEIKEAETQITNVARTLPDSYLFSQQNEIKRDSQIADTIKLVLAEIAIPFILLIFIQLYALLSIEYKNRIPSLEVYLRLGMPKKHLYRLIRNELTAYFALLFIASIVLQYVLAVLMDDVIWHYLWLVAVFATFIICAAFIMTRNLYRFVQNNYMKRG